MPAEELRDREAQEELIRRLHDAQSERNKHEPQWDDNNKLVMGNHKEVNAKNTSHRYLSINRIQNTVVIQTAVQTETPPRPQLQPRESNEPPVWFLRGSGMSKLTQINQQLPLTQGQMNGQEPIPDALARQILQITMPVEQRASPESQEQPSGEGEGERPQTVTVDQPVFSEDDFHQITDQLAADAITQEMMSEWELANGDSQTRTNIYETNVIGHGDMLVQWDPQDQRFTLMGLYPYNTWIDRWATNSADAQHFIIREVKDVKEAIRDHSDVLHEKTIRSLAKSPQESTFWAGSRRTGSKFDAKLGERPVVEVWTMWERHAPFPMSEEEAIRRNLVTPANEERVNTQFNPETQQDEQSIEDVPLVDEETGDRIYQLEDGSLTAPGDDKWPVRHGLRQLQMIDNIKLFDDESDFVDMPVVRNKNIPIAYSPYGQGEPQRLQELNDLYNRLWSIFLEYFKNFRSQTQAMPQSVYDAIEETLNTLHTTSGMKVGIPDHIAQTWGLDNSIRNLEVPQLGDAIFNLMQMVDQEIDKLGGTVNVLRGEAKSEWSGELFQQVTSAARGPIGFKARHTTDMLVHLGKVAANLIIDFLPVDELARRNTKYPPQVWMVMKSRLKRVGFDVSVEVSGASTREQDQQKMLQLWQAGASISPTFTEQMMEKFEIPQGSQIAQEIAMANTPSPE